MFDRGRALEELVSLSGTAGGRVLVVTGVDSDALADELGARLAPRLGEHLSGVDLLKAKPAAPSDRVATVVLLGALESTEAPTRLLEAARDRLAPGGHVVALVPNVAHGSLRLGLLAGRSPLVTDDSGRARNAWDRLGVERLFAGVGLPVRTWRRIVSSVFEGSDAFPPALGRALRQDPEAVTVAFVVKAVVGEKASERASGERPARVPHASSTLEELRAGSLDVLDPRAIAELHSVSQSLSFRAVVRFRDLSKRLFPLASLRGRVFWSLLDRAKWLVGHGRARSLGRSQPRVLPRLGPTPEELRGDAERFLASQERLVFTAESAPRVSVLVVTFNKVEFTLRCLRELRDRARVPLEVILVDNASSDATPRLLERLQNVRVIRNATNEHFLRASNQAAREAKAPALLLLNSDAFVTEGAVAALLETLERDAKVGAVGARLAWPDGRLQEAGSMLFRDGSAHGYGRGEDPERGEFGFVREVDFGSGAALMVRAATWRRLGGFDERFAPAYYEDADLCVAIRESGERVVYEPRALVVHNEFTSSSREAAAELCRKNQAVFVAKWRATLERRPPPGPASILEARDRRAGEPILVIDDRLPRPDQGAGYPRMLALVRALAARGSLVTVVPLFDGDASPDERRALGALGIEALAGEVDLARVLRERRGLVKVVLVSRPHTAEVAIPLVRAILPEALLVYDAEALFHERERERTQVQGAHPGDPDPERLRQRELGLMARADRIVVVSERDAALVARETGRPVFAWPHALVPRVPVTPFADRRDLLFVGSFTAIHSPNEDAVLHFARVVLPRIREALPGVRLLIAGTRPTDAVLALESDAVAVLGRVPDLVELYERCRVFVNPLRFGAGIPLKLLEAMAHGIPTVASAVAARGLAAQMPVGANDEEFVLRVRELYGDEVEWARVQRAGLNFIAKELDPATLAARLEDVISPSGAKKS